MDDLSFSAYLIYIILKLTHGQGLVDAHNGGFLAERRLGARPHDVVDGQFIAEDNLRVVVHIDDGGQPGIVQAKEILERGVLPESVGVVGIVHAHLVIAEEQQ